MFAKIFVRSLIFALAAVALTASAPRLITFDGSLHDSAVVGAMAASQIAAGDGFMQSREFGSAEQAYEVAATLNRARGETPVEAMRRIANARFYRGDYDGAAEALADLADEAATVDDRKTEFWASLDAAQMDRLAGDADGFERSLTRAQILLDSEAFSAAERDDVVRTVTNAELTVLAPHLISW